LIARLIAWLTAGVIAIWATPKDGAVRAAADRSDFEIELGRGAAVELELGRAGGAPERGAGKIEIGVFDRALQLIGARTGEKHDRGMRLDDIDRPGTGG